MSTEPSPRPWRVETNRFGQHYVVCESGSGDRVRDYIAGPIQNESDAALIVDAVNERDSLVENLKTANANRDRESAVWASLATELKAERDRAVKFAEAAPHPGSAPWKEMQAVYAERDRLRDLVRRLLAIAEPAVSELKEIDAAVLSVGGASVLPVAEKEAIIREARAAIGEDKK